MVDPEAALAIVVCASPSGEAQTRAARRPGRPFALVGGQVHHGDMRGTGHLATAVLILVLLSGCGDDPSVVTGTGTVTSSAGTVDVECLGRYKLLERIASWFELRVTIVLPQPPPNQIDLRANLVWNRHV